MGFREASRLVNFQSNIQNDFAGAVNQARYRKTQNQPISAFGMQNQPIGGFGMQNQPMGGFGMPANRNTMNNTVFPPLQNNRPTGGVNNPGMPLTFFKTKPMNSFRKT